MKLRALFFLCLVVLGTSAPAQTAPSVEAAKVTLHVGKAELQAELAATPDQEERGLMFRSSLSDNDGMLFFLPAVKTAEFWMKNTLIPLSIAFIDKNGVIVEIHDMQPGDPRLPDGRLPRTRSVSDQIYYALETNLHWFALNGVKPGDKIAPSPAELRRTLSSPAP